MADTGERTEATAETADLNQAERGRGRGEHGAAHSPRRDDERHRVLDSGVSVSRPWRGLRCALAGPTRGRTLLTPASKEEGEGEGKGKEASSGWPTDAATRPRIHGIRRAHPSPGVLGCPLGQWAGCCSSLSLSLLSLPSVAAPGDQRRLLPPRPERRTPANGERRTPDSMCTLPPPTRRPLGRDAGPRTTLPAKSGRRVSTQNPRSTSGKQAVEAGRRRATRKREKQLLLKSHVEAHL